MLELLSKAICAVAGCFENLLSGSIVLTFGTWTHHTEWAPFQPVGAPSVEGQLDQDIKHLKLELFEIDEEIERLTAQGIPPNPVKSGNNTAPIQLEHARKESSDIH